VDFLGVLFLKRGGLAPGADPAKILVVDDEPISLRAVSFALEKARLKPVTVQDPLVALTMCGETKYDLIFLDVDMPNMTGFELCSKIRTEQTNKSTPVVFVTGLTTFESRANSTISGGNDFIAKPFLFIELAVKALIHLLRTRLEPVKA
jgi:DNA-binding response OmpR family regulator